MTIGMTARAVQTVASVPVVGAVVALQVHGEKRAQSVAAVAHSQPGILSFFLTTQATDNLDSNSCSPLVEDGLWYYVILCSPCPPSFYLFLHIKTSSKISHCFPV